MRRPLGGRRSGERGQGLVEFALVLPVLVLMLFAVFDFGRAVYAFHTLSNASREAARVAIVNQTTATIKARGSNVAVALGIPASGVQIVGYKQATDANLGSNPSAASNCATVQIGCIAVIRVAYVYTPITPIISNVVGTINLASTAQLPVEAVCVNTPPRCP